MKPNELLLRVVEAREGVEIVKKALDDARLELEIAEFNLKEAMKREHIKTLHLDNGRVSRTTRTVKKLRNEAEALEVLGKFKVPLGEVTAVRVLTSKVIKKLEELGELDLIEKEQKEGITITTWEQVDTADNLKKLGR